MTDENMLALTAQSTRRSDTQGAAESRHHSGRPASSLRRGRPRRVVRFDRPQPHVQPRGTARLIRGWTFDGIPGSVTTAEGAREVRAQPPHPQRVVMQQRPVEEAGTCGRRQADREQVPASSTISPRPGSIPGDPSRLDGCQQTAWRTPPATGPARSGIHAAYGAPRRHTMPSAQAVVKRAGGARRTSVSRILNVDFDVPAPGL